jgi:hypothetical protein
MTTTITTAAATDNQTFAPPTLATNSEGLWVSSVFTAAACFVRDAAAAGVSLGCGSRFLFSFSQLLLALFLGFFPLFLFRLTCGFFFLFPYLLQA